MLEPKPWVADGQCVKSSGHTMSGSGGEGAPGWGRGGAEANNQEAGEEMLRDGPSEVNTGSGKKGRKEGRKEGRKGGRKERKEERKKGREGGKKERKEEREKERKEGRKRKKRREGRKERKVERWIER